MNSFFPIFFLGFSIFLVGCSHEQRPSEKVGETLAEAVDFQFDIDVESTILNYGTKTESLYKLTVPADAFRRVTPGLVTDIADGEFVSSVLYLHQVLKDGQLHNPTKMVGEWVQAKISVSLTGTDLNYDERAREGYVVSRVEDVPVQILNGATHFKDFEVWQSDRQLQRYFIWNSEKYGQIRIDCRRSVIALARKQFDSGGCTTSFLLRDRLILSITYPVNFLRDWREITEDVVRLTEEWELEDVE